MTPIPHFGRLFEDALTLARGIGEPRHRDFVLRSIATALGSAKRFDEAARVRSEIGRLQERSAGVCCDFQYVFNLAKNGRFDEAKQAAMSLEKSHRPSVLAEIALLLAKSGKTDETRELLAEMERQIDTGDKEETEYDRTLVHIGAKQLELGWVDEALATARRCRPENRHGLLVGVMQVKILYEGPVAAKPLLDELLELSRSLDAEHDGNARMPWMAEWHAKCRYFAEATAIADSIVGDPENKAEALLNVAKEMFALTCFDAGYRLFWEAKQVIETIADPCAKALTLCKTVGVCDDEDAKKTYDQALELALSTPETMKRDGVPDRRSTTLVQIAKGLFDAGYLQDALAVKGMLAHPQHLDVVRCHIGYTLAHRGDYETALALVGEEENAIDRGERLRMIVHYMLGRDDVEKVWQLAERTTAPDDRAVILAMLAANLAEYD